MMEMLSQFQYCPPNVTVHDFWWNYGISHCALDTISSLALAGLIVVFGSIEILAYRMYGTPIEDSSQIPTSKLYHVQILLLTLASFSSFMKYVLESYLFPDSTIYGYTIVTSWLTCISFLFSIRLIWMERFHSLALSSRRGHGTVLLIFWALAFINENISMLSVKHREWCFYAPRDLAELLVLATRYVCSFSIFVLGLKAPGIAPNHDNHYKELDVDEKISDDSETYSIWLNGWQNTRRLMRLIWTPENLGLKVRLVFCASVLVVERFINLLIPVYNQKIVDNLGTKVFCWDLILVFIGLKFLQGGGSSSMGVLYNLRSFSWENIREFISREIQVQLFAHLHSLSLRWHLARKTGEVLRVMDRSPGSIVRMLHLIIVSIIPAVIDILIAIIFFSITIDWYFGLIVLAAMTIYIPLIIYVTEERTRIQKRMRKADNNQVSQSIDSLLNFETVKYYGAEKYELEVYHKAILEYQEENLVSHHISCVSDTVQNIVICGSLLAGSLFCAHLVADVGTLTPGQYVLFSSHIVELYASLNYFGAFYGYIRSTLVEMKEMLDFLDEKPEVNDSPDATEMKIPNGAIEFSNVTFGYNSERVILKNVSFTVPSGKTVAIVGPTGSGKSTIIRLLFRFYDVNAGSISIDDQNIASVTQDSLRRAIGVVPQDTVLFNNSLKYNIRYGRRNASDEDVIAAARAADIHDDIMKFPDQYDTEVGERGLRLSGGEKQRVAIARTILKAPSIVLLDEATSSLDTKTERNIQAALSEVCSNRTTIIVAHRLSTIIHADEILVLKDGEIVERGRHETLLSEDGIYADMWNQQLRNDDDTNSKIAIAE